MMVARMDKIAQVHDIKIAIHDHRRIGNLNSLDYESRCCHLKFLGKLNKKAEACYASA
jgi:hypothetical protein